MPTDPADVTRRFYRLLSAGRIDDALELVDRDYAGHGVGGGGGRDGLKDDLMTWAAAFPDLEVDIVDTIAAGERVAVRVRLEGTHSGTFAGLAATHQRFEISSNDMLVIRDGRILAAWMLYDLTALLVQLGGLENSGRGMGSAPHARRAPSVDPDHEQGTAPGTGRRSPMAEHPNEAVVRRLYTAFSAGDGEALASIFAPDVVWSTPGQSRITGEYKGLDEVLGLFALCGELTGGNLKVEPETVKAQGDTLVVSTHRVIAERDGKKLDVHETERVMVEDGRITRVDESVSDQAASDAFWS